MEILEAAGNQAEGLRAFDDLRRLLRDELGTAPGPAVMAVYERLLRGGPPAAAARPARPGRSPGAGPRRSPLPSTATRSWGAAPTSTSCARAGTRARRAAAQLVVLAGDAGIGKTRLAAEFAAGARDEGAAVLYGRFDEEALAPYQPFVEMLRGWAGGASLAPLRERLGPRGAELGLAAARVRRPRPRPVAASLRLGDRRPRAAAVRRGRRAARGDRRAARRSSSSSTTSTGPTGRRCSYPPPRPRPGAAPRAVPRHLPRAELPEEPAARARRRCAARARCSAPSSAGSTPARSRARRRARGRDGLARLPRGAHGETEGNPFFIEEVVRHLPTPTAARGARAAERGARGRPRGHRAPAGAPGRPVPRDGGRLGGRPRVRLRRARQRRRRPRGRARGGARGGRRGARGARGRGPRRPLPFAHALVRATLYDDVSALRRARLHGRVGGGDPRAPRAPAGPAPLRSPTTSPRPRRSGSPAARSTSRSRPPAGPTGSWPGRRRRGTTAARSRCASSRVTTDERTRCELLLALAGSEDRAGDTERGRRAAAAETARALGDPVLLGRAALGFAGPWSMLGRADEDVAACSRRPWRRSAPRTARCAPACSPGSRSSSTTPASRSGGSSCQRGGGGARPAARRPATLAVCLDARHYALWRPETVEQRLEVAAELRRIAEQAGDPELELEGAAWTIIDLLELGDVRRRRRAARGGASASPPGCTGRCTSGGRRSCAPRAPSSTGASRRPRRSPRTRSPSASAARRRTPCTTSRWRSSTSGASRGGWRRSRRRCKGFISLYPAIPAWRCALALLNVELGRPQAARRGVHGRGRARLRRPAP